MQALRLLLFFFFCHAGQPARKKKSLWEGQKKRRPLHGLALTSEPEPITMLLTFSSAAHPLVFFFLGLSASCGFGSAGQWGAATKSSRPAIWYDHGGNMYRWFLAFVDSRLKNFFFFFFYGKDSLFWLLAKKVDRSGTI